MAYEAEKFKIIRSDYRWDQPVVTYNFYQTPPSNLNYNGFYSFSQEMITAAENAFRLIERYTNVKFQRVSNTDSSANISLGGADLWGSYAGQASPPPNINLRERQSDGDVWIDVKYRDPATSEDASLVIMHEIGHAMGLGHGNVMNIPFYSDYTIMTIGGLGGIESYKIIDIAALQELYGVNRNYNSGNTTYTFNSNDLRQAVWDAGGNDTFDFSQINRNITIRLGEGELSSINNRNDVGIAYGVVIENARAGSGNDVVYGNAAANRIYGNAGSDVLYGQDGNDWLYGGVGNDQLYGDNHADRLYGQDGNDILNGGRGIDTLTGGAGRDVFKFSFTDAVDVVTDFQRGVDRIDLSSLLNAFNPVNDAITSFVRITTSNGDSNLFVDTNGGANSFVRIAVLEDVTGLNVGTLYNNGTIIA